LLILGDTKEVIAMKKKYIVRLTDAERPNAAGRDQEAKGSSLKVRRAQVLLKADADGPAWTDQRIAEAFGCRTKTVENIRQRLVTEGFEVTLDGKPRGGSSSELILDGDRKRR